MNFGGPQVHSQIHTTFKCGMFMKHIKTQQRSISSSLANISYLVKNRHTRPKEQRKSGVCIWPVLFRRQSLTVVNMISTERLE